MVDLTLKEQWIYFQTTIPQAYNGIKKLTYAPSFYRRNRHRTWLPDLWREEEPAIRSENAQIELKKTSTALTACPVCTRWRVLLASAAQAPPVAWLSPDAFGATFAWPEGSATACCSTGTPRAPAKSTAEGKVEMKWLERCGFNDRGSIWRRWGLRECPTVRSKNAAHSDYKQSLPKCH